MNAKSIAIIAALDTKGEEAQFVADIIRQRGHRVTMIDIGVLSDPKLNADISSGEIASAGGIELEVLRGNGNKAQAMETMTRGAAVIAAQAYSAKRFEAILGLGGSAGTAIAASAMRSLPIGVPKMIVSTVAAGDTRPYVAGKDIALLYSVVDIAGLNRISTQVLANAAGAIIGMAETHRDTQHGGSLIVASMFGNTTRCIDRARNLLQAKHFEVLVFHATGSGGATMEGLIAEGLVDGVLDMTTTEWADELCGGVFTAGPTRLEAAARAGIPQIVAPGCLDMVNFAAPDTVPERYAGRKLFRWNPNVTLMRTNIEENARLGEILASKLNQAAGLVKVILPLRGLSELDSPGGEFWWPEADRALFDNLRRNLRPEIPVIELDANINDIECADRAANELLGLMSSVKSQALAPMSRDSHEI